VLLTGVHFLQCSEYWVMCINVCVIHVWDFSTDFCVSYVSNAFKCVPFYLCFYNVYWICYGLVCYVPC
jgi:hypothetical protein